jgi:hypothetical protein
MNDLDRKFWATWTKFEDAGEFKVFRAWAIEGSCIQQRMGLFDDVPDSWHKLKPYVEKLKTYEQANMGIIDPEYIKSFLYIRPEELIHTLDTKKSEFSHRVILVNINRLYRNDMTDEELYETTRGTWRVRADRKNPEFAIAIYQKKVLEVYKINKWYEAGTLKYRTRDSFQTKNRWEFEGEKAEESVRKQYIGLNVKRSYGNSIRYINCNN